MQNVIKKFKRDIKASNVPYCPKIVILNSIKSKKKDEESDGLKVDY